MAVMWSHVVAIVLLTTAVVIAMPNHTPSAPSALHRREPEPNHTPSAPGVLHKREPNHTPSAPGVLHRREPNHTPSAPGVLHRRESPATALVERQMSTISAAAPTVTAATPKSTQGPQIDQLIAGIGFNIMAQKAEIAVVSIMQGLGQAPASTAVANATLLYQVAKDDLLSFMSAGMRIRGNNMQLSGVNPQITRGLAQLEEQQVLQMAMANNLTGNAATDAPLLEKLQGGFQAAIQKNMGLQSLATGGSNLPMMTKAVGV